MSEAAEHDDAGAPETGTGRDWSWISLVLGLAALAWAVMILLPSVRPLPAWPAASVGVFAMILARLPGRALPRAIGAFAGFVAFLVGALQIAALWGLVEILSR
ncbi:hypothetical protein PPSIR1_10270 [Plesiocystis pacifica SIR-1]|uniref:Uncharacterized protein n=1 Tax=Plesiocystis pacifica SIR-1 TaxID=391625 RepID=A6GFF6_9BACT|nr:hypothetical protein [Plesiocystis pacifica]EDM75383.1 hypothetical protein PPSIR1_10270 [Plesiocystis pacifica SIR-1]